jgi:spore maturation protein SpmA
VLNGLFVAAVIVSLLLAGASGGMERLTRAIVDDAGKAVSLSIGLVGVMALFLGLMRVVERAGVLAHVARALGPLTRRLFPDVPAGHPALQAMILNVSSNLLGLANAATPFGIKAMEELDRLNREKGTATDAMVLFLAINTAGMSLVPTTVIAVRASLGSADPAGIVVPTWIASGVATAVGIAAAIGLSRLPRYRAAGSIVAGAARVPPDDLAAVADPGDRGREGESSGADAPASEPAVDGAARGISGLRTAAAAAFVLAMALLAARELASADGAGLRGVASFWLLPLLVGAVAVVGWACRVRVYDALVEGAREGFQVALRILPYLVAVLVGVGMLRASGAIELFVRAMSPLTERILLPAEALPMAVLRPLTGSGALAVMSEVMAEHGPDSGLGYLVSTMQGSTETTFYVLAVYFGAVGIRRTRHALPACLLADAAGLLTAAAVVRWWLGG